MDLVRQGRDHSLVAAHTDNSTSQDPSEVYLNLPSTLPQPTQPDVNRLHPRPYYPTPSAPAPRQRSAIACKYCRKRKIRCLGYDSSPDGRCQNCVRFNQQCIFHPISSQAAFVPASAIHRPNGKPLGVPGQPGSYPPLADALPFTHWPKLEETLPPCVHESASSSSTWGGGMKLHEVPGNSSVSFSSRPSDYMEKLFSALRKGDSDMTEKLLAIDMDIENRHGLYDDALEAAFYWGHGNVVQLLLDKGANFGSNAGGYEDALYTAAYMGYKGVVQLLLDKGVNVDSDAGVHGTALQAAALRGHESVVQQLLDNGAGVNIVSGQHGTALQAAASRGYESIIQLLLDNGADVNVVSGRYGTALNAATIGSYKKVVQVLLDHGADVNCDAGMYGTALQAAAYRGHESVVQLLLDNGADVNVESGQYETALHAATTGGHKKVFQLLLDHEADFNARNRQLDTALEVVASNGSEEVLQLLLDGKKDKKAKVVDSGITIERLLPSKPYDFDILRHHLGATESGEISVPLDDYRLDRSFSNVFQTSTVQPPVLQTADHHSPLPNPAKGQVLRDHMEIGSAQAQSSREDRDASGLDFSESSNDFPVLGFSRHLGLSTEGEYTSTKHLLPGLLSLPSTLALRRSEDGKSPSSGYSTASSSSITCPEQMEAQLRAFIQISAMVLLKLCIRSVQQSRNIAQCANAGRSENAAISQDHELFATETDSGKRKRRSRSNDDDDEDEDKKRQKHKCRSSKSSVPSSTDMKPLACPFNKFDDRLFGQESRDTSYRICGSCSFVTIGHLKQHLKRNHYLPQHYCFACCDSFSSQMMLAQHQRQRPACETREPPLHPERIGSDLIDELKLNGKNDVGTDPIDYWFKIFNRFFPGEKDVREISPFYEGSYASAVHRFIQFADTAFPQILPIIHRRMSVNLDNTSSTHELQLHHDVLQKAGERFLRHLEGAAMPQLGKGRAEYTAESGSSLGTISGGAVMEEWQDISSELEACNNMAGLSTSSLPPKQLVTPNTSESPEDIQDQQKKPSEDELMAEETIPGPEDVADSSDIFEAYHETIALCMSDIQAESLVNEDLESLLHEFCQETELPTLELSAGGDFTFPFSK